MTPDRWQQVVLDDWLGQTRGKWSALTCGLSVPRQNGKNTVLEIRELFGMVGRGERVLHTAHQLPTARKAFKRLMYFFGTQRDDPVARFPELNALVTEVRLANGQEAVVLKNGGSVEVVARSKNSGRGFTADVLVMDEAQELSDDDLEALMPTTSAAPKGDPQWIFTGTPPGPKAAGDVFGRVRQDALDGKSSRLAWHEWSGPTDVDLDDSASWESANPALLAGRLQRSVVEGERARFSDEGFRRERLGMWDSVGHSWVIPRGFWDAAGDLSSVAVDRLSVGVEVGRDAAWASVAIAGQRVDGGWHLELVERREGADWVVPFVAGLLARNPSIRAVVADAGSPSSVLFDAFARERVRLHTPRVAELGTGCTNLLNGIVGNTTHHTKQAQMDAAVAAAGKRALRDTAMWVWSRKTAQSDITPIQAATLALIGAQAERPVKPVRSVSKQRVVVM